MSERTVRRRVGQVEFSRRVAAERSMWVSRTASRLAALTPRGVDTLDDLLDASVPAAVQLRAALGVLESSRVWREGTVVRAL